MALRDDDLPELGDEAVLLLDERQGDAFWDDDADARAAMAEIARQSAEPSAAEVAAVSAEMVASARNEAAQPAGMPPERVRFSAPLRMESEDGARYAEGTVVNLSVRGLAAVAAFEAQAGERVWTSFRLGQAEDPVCLLAQVIWCQSAVDDQRAFGLEFEGLTRDEALRLEETVRERASGRGDGEVTVAPEAIAARRPNPWISAAAGMAAGIGLALVVSIVPRTGVPAPEPAARLAVEQGPPATPVAAEAIGWGEPDAVAGAVPIRMAAIEAAPPVTVAPAAPAVDGATPATDVGVRSAAESTKPPEPATATRVEAPAKPAPRPERVPERVKAATAKKPAPLPRKAEPVAGDDSQRLRPTGAGDRMSLALLADGPVEKHAAFWLASPRRLVVDVFGRKSGFASLGYAIEHPLATRLRIGQHGDKVRYVIETAADVQTDVELRPQGKAVVVTLRAVTAADQR